MPSFINFFTLAACVLASLAASDIRCNEAKVVGSKTITVSGGEVTLNTFSCAAGTTVAKRQSSSSGIFNLAGQSCTIFCNNNAGPIPPVAADCNQILQAIQILAGINPTFTVTGLGQQALVLKTCAFIFQNNLDEEVSFGWLDFGNDASQAGSACFPPKMPFFSEGLCTAINGEWSIAAAHS